MFFVFKKVRKSASHSGGKEYSHLAVESIHFWQVLWLRFGLSVSPQGFMYQNSTAIVKH